MGRAHIYQCGIKYGVNDMKLNIDVIVMPFKLYLPYVVKGASYSEPRAWVML